MADDFLPWYRRAGCWRFFIVWGPFFLFLILFRRELGFVRDYLLGVLGSTAPLVAAIAGLEPVIIYAGLKILTNIFVFCGVYFISLFVIAQFILPVRTLHERRMAGGRLLNYWFGRHGPAVFVREGKLVARVGEAENISPGVALVDLRSALVVEQTYPWVSEDGTGPDGDSAPPQPRSSFLSGRRSSSQEDQYPVARVYGPGINFTQWGEKIRNVIDLRPQLRREAGVKAFTKDGIEIETRVFAGFSLSSPPEVISVGYVGGCALENLYGLVIKEKSPGAVAIAGKYGLDPEDAREIHDYVMSGAKIAKAAAPVAVPASQSAIEPPFPFDEQRIFSAAYGQAYRGSSDPKTQWDELPGLVAVEIFRSHIGQYTYDYLYLVDDPKRTPWMDEVKPEFSRKVRHQGLLSFKLVRFARSNRSGAMVRWNVDPFDEKHFGQVLHESALEYSSPRPLQNTFCKPLREHGIVIIFAGFSELKPPPVVRTRMAERWKAKLDLEIKTILARNERETMQVINNARTQAQREATYYLSNLLKREKHSKEALALLLFQALQAAATDEKRHKDLPPREIIAMMQNLHRWLLLEWEESEAKKKGPKEAKQPPTVTDSTD